MNSTDFALNVIAKASIILGGVALLSILLRRASASTRHAVWVLALLSSLLLPLAAILVPQLELPVMPQAGTSVSFSPVGNRMAPATDVEPGPKPSTTYLAGTLLLQPGFLWAFGAALLLVRLALGGVAVRRLAKSAVTAEDNSWRELMEKLSNAFFITQPVRL